MVAKTTDPNPKLPGTLYSAAEEIEAAGGQALPLQWTSATRRSGARGSGSDHRDALRPDERRQRPWHLPVHHGLPARTDKSPPRPAQPACADDVAAAVA
jgi:hypothetical protein